MIGWWQLASARVSKLLERSRTLMHYIRAAILWARESSWKCCRVQTKFVTHWGAIISEAVTLIDQNTVHTYFGAGKEIAVLCSLWHLWIISQPKDCSTWKEPGLVRYCFSGRVVYRQIRRDHLGHSLRMLLGWSTSNYWTGKDIYPLTLDIGRCIAHQVVVNSIKQSH